MTKDETPVLSWKGLVGIGITANMASGLALVLLAVLLNDLSLAPRPLSGLWSCVMKVRETSYDRYEDLRTGSVLAIVSGFDNRITGTFERYWDETPQEGRTIYPDDKIVHGTIIGHYERRLLFNRRRNGIHLHILVGAHVRSPTYLLSLKLKGNDQMDGTYVATVAKHETGDVSCERGSE